MMGYEHCLEHGGGGLCLSVPQMTLALGLSPDPAIPAAFPVLPHSSLALAFTFLVSSEIVPYSCSVPPFQVWGIK